MELGMSPIFTAGFIMQILNGIKLIKADMSSKEDRELFMCTMKLIAFLITLGQSVGYVISGMYGPYEQLGLIKSILIVV